MRNPMRFLACVFGWFLLTIVAFGEENLVPDASFESPLPGWFAERSGTSYYAGKERVADAVEGRTVLAIEGWDQHGGTILSGPIRLADDETGGAVFSATVAVRSIGVIEDVTFELALFDEKGTKRLASFGQVPLDGKGAWRTVAQDGVRLETSVATARLGLVLTGPPLGARVEVDCVGLSCSTGIEPVTDNSDLAVQEAEDLANDTTWKVAEHYPNWYQGRPSGMKMLAGPDAIQTEQNAPVSCRLPVRHAGRHVLWLRFLAGPYAGKFTVVLRQNGSLCAEKEFREDDPRFERQYRWVWDSLPVELQEGEVELELTRPAQGASWVTRKLDLFVLTNRRDYQPEVEHFRTQGYLRFTNLSTGQDPFCQWIWIRRHEGPEWYANPGMLSRAGLSEGYYVPDDKTKWLAPGDRSPWVRISDYLLAAGERNNVQMIATRRMHTQGFVEGRVRGRLEFAVGPDRRVVKTIEVDQEAPRILLTLPYDLEAQSSEIKTALDYVKETEAAITRLGPVEGSRAERLNLAANLSLRAGVDDPEIVRREIEILKALGFNQTYQLIGEPQQAVSFYQQHGLLPRFGGGPWLWNAVEHNSQHHPDLEAMGKRVEEFAERRRGILDRFVRFKLMDEPSGMRYEDIVESQPCRVKFVEWLRSQGLTPPQLGVATWAEVAPVLPQDSQANRELFYHTGIFRLEAFATLAKACVQAKRSHLPNTMRTYVNYSPPTGGGSWTERGTDPFLAHRDGGMEMIWTEDWLGYSLGPQHLSDTLALCRAAGRPDRRPLGAYCVGQGTPTLMRMKYYTLVAGGVRDIESYDYGPWYAGIDSWGRQFELYGAIRDCQFELGAIDPYLHETTRRKTDVAILYNRTASIWSDGNNSSQFNGSYTHWALAHAGYDADFLAEEDVESGRLERYKVLYLDGPQLRHRSAEAIRAWVESGGVLFASAGAGSRNKYDRTTDILDPTFGVRSLEFAAKAAAGRPKFDLLALKPLERLNAAAAANAPTTEIDQLCYQEHLEALPGAEVILVDTAGRPAGTLNKFGRGMAIRVAALPGISYAHEAVQAPYDPDAYLPHAFRTELRDFLAWPARLAGVAPVAEASSPIAEIVRYDGPGRAVVFVIDHRAEPVERFTFTLADAGGFTRALTATGAPAEIHTNDDGSLTIALSLNTADAVALLKQGAADE